ncbi:uncharacterized protein LOC125944290 [Dermacentor silvarum]|uniref:uncharacterized protein LOC125944290 n=1 Tax=Dermacentor silvarum TaxID=543639 RepID=UPI00210102D9|nr:uncharacterized protein LOC125944290 [Dermacentor silvarum]
MSMDDIKFLKKYIDYNIKYLGANHVHNAEAFKTCCKQFFEVSTKYVHKLNHQSAQSFRYFASIAEIEPTKWTQIALDIERDMNTAVLFVAETYESVRGRDSICLVGGTAWELPAVCGRQGMKTWIESAQAPNFRHGSAFMPSISVSATVYDKMSAASSATLAEMRKSPNVISASSTRDKSTEKSYQASKLIHKT